MGRPGRMIRSAPSALFSNVRGDISGAFVAAIISFPQAVGYGLVAFAPLGADFSGSAAVLGIYSAVLAGFFAALIGSTPIQITGPKVPLTLLIGAVVAELAASERLTVAADARPLVILGSVSFCVLIGGVVQFFLGASRFGTFVKYVPYPVVSGFMNGVAVLLVLKQIKPLLGVPDEVALLDLFARPAAVEPATLLVGVGTLVGIFLSKRYIRRVPAYLTGLAIGTAIHYGLDAITSAPALGPLVGTIRFAWPELVSPVGVFGAAAGGELVVFVLSLVIAGLSIGLVGSLESLFSSIVSDNLTNHRHDSGRELIGQGVGNLVCSLVGALPAAGSIPRSQANFRAGGRTRLSGMLCAVFVFLMFAVLGPLVGQVPLAAVAGMLMFVGFDLFDDWSVNLLRKLRAELQQRKKVVLDLIVALAVAIITVSVNLVVAVGVGVAAASLLFIFHMGKSVVRREYDGAKVHARKMRSREDEQYLTTSGEQILVLELQGPIFFGSGDKLMNALDRAMEHVRYCILDMKRVTEIDSTGTRILPQIKRLVERDGKHLLISHLTEGQPLWQFLDFMGVVETLGKEHFHPDTDAALEWAEEHLLAHSGHLPTTGRAIGLEAMAITDGLDEAELQYLRGKMHEESFPSGALIFEEGHNDEALILVARGSVAIKQKMPSSGQLKRVFTYAPGSVIGELAFLDRAKRSAGAWADQDVQLFRLARSDFQSLKDERPQLAAKLLENLAREVSRKLRRTSAELAALEDTR